MLASCWELKAVEAHMQVLQDFGNIDPNKVPKAVVKKVKRAVPSLPSARKVIKQGNEKAMAAAGVETARRSLRTEELSSDRAENLTSRSARYCCALRQYQCG